MEKRLRGCNEVIFSAKWMQSPVFMRYMVTSVAFLAAQNAWNGITSQNLWCADFRKILVGV
jgi:hypothetical protein